MSCAIFNCSGVRPSGSLRLALFTGVGEAGFAKAILEALKEATVDALGKYLKQNGSLPFNLGQAGR
jgi:hypothetical protein